MEHRVGVAQSGSRARAQCSCGHDGFVERRGDRAGNLARIDGESHLESVSRQVNDWARTDSGFTLCTSLDTAPCPICKVGSSVDFSPNSFNEVTCERGHVFEYDWDEGYHFVQEAKASSTPGRVASSEYPVAVIDMNTEAPSCPTCGLALLFGRVDVLRGGGGPYIVNCSAGHDFDAYVRDIMTVYLFTHQRTPWD